MSYTENERQVVSIVAEMAGLDIYEVDPTTKFSDLSFDSLDSLDLIHRIETTLDVSIDDNQLDEIKAVGDVFKLLPS